MSLPEGIEPRSREEWMKLAGDADMAGRKVVNDVLKACKVSAVEYVTWNAAQKVDVIMKHQGEGEEKPKGAKAPATGKGAKAAAATTTAATSSGGTDAALHAKIDELTGQVAALSELLHDTHFLVRVLIQSDPKLRSNSEDTDLPEAWRGQLVSTSGNAG